MFCKMETLETGKNMVRVPFVFGRVDNPLFFWYNLAHGANCMKCGMSKAEHKQIKNNMQK